MKLFFILATASLLIVATHATIILRSEGDDETDMSSKCIRQVRKMEPQLESCNRYIAMDLIDEKYEEELRRIQGEGCKSEESCMRGCCMAMKEMDDECVCEWMKMVVEKQPQLGERVMRKGIRDLKELPTKCGMTDVACQLTTRGNRVYV